MTSEYASPEYQQELGDGLVLRWATSKDIGSVTQLYGLVWRGAEDDPPNLRMIDQIQRHTRGDFP
ncbi:MAG: GNAT family N-acetyltransferase, partial [Ktedonobacteraceae bacterium]